MEIDVNSTDKILARRYAKAYADADTLEYTELLERVNRLEKIAEQLRPYARTMLHPVISAETKEEILVRILPEQDYARNFMFLLLSKNHFNLLDEIISSCHEILDKSSGTMKAELRTPYPIAEEMLVRIRKLVSPDPDKVKITQTISPDLIGGFELRCGDMLLDASVKGQLKRLEKELEA